MDISRGYLRLFRQMLDWEWYDKPNTKAIFIHCLLCANQKDKIWQGIKIKRGQFITSLEKLAMANGLSIRQTRTALNDLQTTNEIDKQTTNRYSIITVKNYNLYQANDKLKCTLERQANDKQNDKRTTTTNNNIDISNIYNIHTHNNKSVCDNSKNISSEDLKILKSYAKKSGAKNISAYVHKLIENKGYIEILKEEKERQERKKQKQNENIPPPEKQIEDTPEERAKVLEMVREKAEEIRKRI